nr:MAG TPA: hypothetical protein [Caudoviricetes sp.]
MAIIKKHLRTAIQVRRLLKITTLIIPHNERTEQHTTTISKQLAKEKLSIKRDFN